MKKLFSLAAHIVLFNILAQDQISFKREVSQIDSLLIVEAFELADEKLISLQTSVENTSLGAEDTVRLYFTSKLAYIAGKLGDCAHIIKRSKDDVSLRKEIYGIGDPLTLSANRNLGVYYLNCDSLEQAQNILKETLDTHQQEIGVPDELYARTLDDLAFLEGKLGNIEQAIGYYEELLALLGENHGSFYLYVIENYSSFLISNEMYEEAAPFFEGLKKAMKEKAEYPTFLKDYYNLFVNLSDFLKALESSSLLVDWCSKNSAQCEELNISEKEFTLNCGRLATLLFKYEQAEEYYKSAELSYRNASEYPQLLLEQADLYGTTSKRFEQLNSLSKVISYHRSTFTTDSSTYDNAVFKLGGLYAMLGRFDQANDLFENYMGDLEGNPNTEPAKLAAAYQSLGNQRLLLQDFKEADNYLSKAKSVLEENNQKNTVPYASLLNSYGALYETLANYVQAERYYRSALEIVADDNGTLRTALASNLANILIRVDPKNPSIGDYLTNAINWQQSSSGNNHPQLANLFANRGLYFLKLDSLNLALSDLKQSCQIFEDVVSEDHPQYLSARSNLGLLYDVLEENELAESTLNTTTSLYEKYYSKANPGYIRALNNLANHYARTGEYSKAEPLYVELSKVQISEITNSFTYLSESEKKIFVLEKQKLLNNFKNYIVARSLKEEGAIDREVIEKWYNLELSTKGILLNSTKKVRENIFNSGDEELIELFGEWTLVRKQIADLQSLKNNQSSATRAQADSLNQVINELEKELTRKSFDFSSSFNPKSYTYDDIRSQLNPGEALVEIIRTEINGSGVYTALIGTSTMESPELIVIGQGAELEQKGFQTYKNTIAFKVASSKPFDLYWKKIDSYLSGALVTKIYYAPDGVYHKLNPNTFYDPVKEEYLIDELDIVQLSSTKDIMNLQENVEKTPSEALLIGRPAYKDSNEAPILGATRSFQMLNNVSDLPGTEEEVVEIEGLFKKRGLQTDVLIKEGAEENEIKERLNSEIVHIATHGFFLPDDTEGTDPMLNSGLLLAGVSNQRKSSDKDDGILTAYEIMNLSLSNLNLVVLSACETGLGEITSGEGIYGLQRAFFVGGAETLVMSLWKVDDAATKDLMIEFYKEYLKSGNRKASFTLAQRKIKKKYKDPIYWGAFVMVGT